MFEKYEYSVIRSDLSLEEYLDSHVDEVMLRRVDRTELIKKLNVKRNRKLKRSIEILNAALKDRCIVNTIPKQSEETFYEEHVQTYAGDTFYCNTDRRNSQCDQR